MLERVSMVCTGNVCRSPMAEVLLRARLERNGGGTVESAGLAAPRAAFERALGLIERGLDDMGRSPWRIS